MMEVKVVSSVLVYRKGVKGWDGVGWGARPLSERRPAISLAG